MRRGILCTLALIMLALVPAKRNCYIEGCSMRSGLIYRALIILHLLLDRSKLASTYKVIRIDRTRARSEARATFILTSL